MDLKWVGRSNGEREGEEESLAKCLGKAIAHLLNWDSRKRFIPFIWTILPAKQVCLIFLNELQSSGRMLHCNSSLHFPLTILHYKRKCEKMAECSVIVKRDYFLQTLIALSTAFLKLLKNYCLKLLSGWCISAQTLFSFLSIASSTTFKYAFIHISKMLGIDHNRCLVKALVCTHFMC